MKRAKKTMTPEQERARELRKERFNGLCAMVKAMSAEEKAACVAKAGAVLTIENHPLSARNTCLCYFQRANVTMVGGFRQWLKMGRCVLKGEHGMSILVPVGGKKETEGGDTEKVFFVSGTVFDVSQTTEIGEGKELGAGVTALPTACVVEDETQESCAGPVAVVSPGIADAFGMRNLPNVVVSDPVPIRAEYVEAEIVRDNLELCFA